MKQDVRGYLKKALRISTEPVFFIIWVIIQIGNLTGNGILALFEVPITIAKAVRIYIPNMWNGFVQYGRAIPSIIPFPIRFPKVKKTDSSVSGSRLSIPKVQLPKVSVPKISLPHIPLPRISFQKFRFPKVQKVQLKIPRISFPKWSIPAINLPSIAFPKVKTPSIDVPKIFKLKLKKPSFSLPRIAAPPIIKKTGTFIVSHKMGYFVAGAILCFIAVFTWQSYEFVRRLPSPKNIGVVNYPTSTHIYDRNGKLLYEIYRDQNRTPVALAELPDYITQATIAIEDKDFYTHQGISVIGGMFRAIKDTYLTGELQGGSTLTQQLVKSSLLTPERTIERKVKEIILAVWTEQLYSKDEILEMYLNQVPYGGSSYGIEEASNAYFNKSAKELTLAEAAFLAGLPQAPSLYSPYLNPELATNRRNEVLKRMREENFISDEELQKATATNLVVRPPVTDIQAPHFVFYVKQQLEKEYGPDRVEEGGLRVTTTLDLDVQKQAEQILKEEVEKVRGLNVGNGAILVTDPKTGEVLAMVGSVDYYEQPFGAFNVTTADRQPGSSIKPLTYSLALENGFTAATLIDDSPLVVDIPGSEPYRPVNYDGRFHGRVPMRMALANSYNIPAVKLLQALGVQRLALHAQKLGIDTWNDTSRFGLSLTLGGGEVKMTDMAELYGVFASGGKLTNLDGVLKVESLSGDEIPYTRPQSRQVMNEGVTYILSDMLSDNYARQAAFGLGSALEIPGAKVAVKTGTTNDLKDNWTIGYTPNYVVTVWVGNNDSTPMAAGYVSGITGAAPIWNRTMTYLLGREKVYQQELSWYEQPSNVVAVPCQGRTEYFLAGTERTVGCGQWNQNNQWNRWNPNNQQWNNYRTN